MRSREKEGEGRKEEQRKKRHAVCHLDTYARRWKNSPKLSSFLPSKKMEKKNIGTKHSEIAKFVGREVSPKFSEKKTVGKAEQTTYGDRKGGDGGEDGTHNDAN